MGAVLRPSQELGACELIFANRSISTFWSLGKVVPIVRWWGVNQPAMEILLYRLNDGGWVNFFQDGRVNADGGFIRDKWGVSRLVWDSTTKPLILSVVYLGMDRVLPSPSERESQTAIFRPGNLVTVNIGSPVDMGQMVERRG